ncbi:Phosphomethylpyrimidine kinase [Methanosalsum zhilinae DSM 4017]|uniref:Phosphomethylpyrimidine kinase n=1 Tax=Methanosalsum zhilinae (strain DSM 4017 / NBRC 107636 / OCM 62 / WeN5) TaxID=679901 RepID=F7XME0_METZD|nr:thiamine-phosphate synthase family protein [Methanosalsum zhilinae]AEH61687.1 Phosphomethylpyrimidine kinase [Methanosalsum zhilinae DSM 4017]
MVDNEMIEMYGKMHIALQKLEKCSEFSSLVPEVRTNLVYARSSAKDTDDVLAVDGRITVVNGMPHASGNVKFAASSHMARLMLELRKVDPSYRAGIDFANGPELASWLEDFCREKKWLFGSIDRSREPEEIKQAEGMSMPWKVQEAVRTVDGQVPKIFYETGAVGKEPVSVLVGSDPLEVVDQVCEIARAYNARK